MSTIWDAENYAPLGHSDVEQMAQNQHFNSPIRNASQTSSPSTIEEPNSAQPSKEKDEDGATAHAVLQATAEASVPAVVEAPILPVPETEAPDGGLTAWQQVLTGHLMNFNTWGYINSYGLFTAYYTSSLHLTASAIAWTASIQIFLLCFIGTFSGRALDAGYYRPVVALGCFFQLLGIFTTSLLAEGQYWQLFLAQGVCQGVGNGLVFTPTVGLVSTYFVRRRSLAMGVMLSGSVTGGIVFPLVAERLLPLVGFAWTVRVMGFLVLFNVAIILLSARTRIAPRKSGPLLELNAFKELPYTLFAIGTFLCLWPVYLAYDYINIYATNVIHVDPSTSIIILLLFNATGYPGRILPALISDHYLGPLNTLLFLTSTCAILLFSWISIPASPSPYASLLTFTIIYGAVNAGVQGLFLTALSSLTTDLSKMGTRIGMIFTVLAFSTLTGAPIGGALIDRAGGGFLGVQVFGGTAMLVGTGVLVAARAAKTGWIWRKRM